MPKKIKKALIIAYYFPPLASGGVQRTTKFIKYLPKFGWRSIVLTVGSIPFKYIDNSNMRDIPSGTPVYRSRDFNNLFARVQSGVRAVETSRSGNPLRSVLPIARTVNWLYQNFFVLGGRIFWIVPATRSAFRIYESSRFDLIYSTSFPMTSHIVGYFIKRKTGLPWVVDFRDPWTQNAKLALKGPRLMIEEWMEKKVLQSSDAIISVSSPIIKSLEKKYPFIKGKTHIIPNGFDPDDFKSVKPNKKANKFIWTYTGILYELRSQNPFLVALANVLERHPNWRSEFEVRFVGDFGGQANLKTISDLGLEDVVKIIGYVPHHQSIQYLKSSSVLFLTVDTTGTDYAKGIYTGKLFEYLAVEKPILSISFPGVAEDLIKESRAGLVVRPHNASGIERAIERYYNDYKSGKLGVNIDKEVVDKFTRYNLTQRLSRIFETVTSKKGS